MQSSNNRQGRGARLEGDEAERVLAMLREDASRNYDNYLGMLNEREDGSILDPTRVGVARELARMNLTLNTYTQWYWKIDLHNLMHFLRLRLDAHAQYEIRAYAEVIASVVARWVPITAEAFVDYRTEAVQLSRGAMEVVRRIIRGDSVTQENSGLSGREWKELSDTLRLEPAARPAP